MRRTVCLCLYLCLLLTACAAEPTVSEIPTPQEATMPAPAPEVVPEPEPEPEPLPEPEPEEPMSWFQPVAEEAAFPEGDVAVFDAYTAAHPEWAADPGQLYREEDGRIVWKNRAQDGGVLPGAVESIVFDPATGEVTEHVSAWRRQGGWPGETVTLTDPGSGLKLTVPAGEEPYISNDGLQLCILTLEQGEEGLFLYSIPSATTGRVLSLYRVPIRPEETWFREAFPGYPDWTLLRVCGAEIARDDQYLYFWGTPGGVEYADVPGEAELYQQRWMQGGFLVDAFIRDNGLRECPQNRQPHSGWEFSPCMLVNSFLVEGDTLYCTLLPSPERSQPADWRSYRWQFRAETPDGPLYLDPPAGEWDVCQRYQVDLSRFTSLTATLIFNQGENRVDMQILP